ncbi:hypothetical protein ACFPMF_01800 [Larkinella bovis]|uniref:Uncharacterized protein n=1 Tax=Larkinella bovis TaxID=683041 RepID=A0ABW0I3C7_9BACT
MTQRYSITSTRFEGELLFEFNEGVVAAFYNNATLNDDQLAFLVKNFPMTVPTLEYIAGTTKTMSIRLVTSEVTFSEFYDAFGLKVNRKEAEKAWEKLTLEQRHRAFESIPSYNYFLMTRPNQNRMYPDTWLRGKFENDYKALAKAK